MSVRELAPGSEAELRLCRSSARICDFIPEAGNNAVAIDLIVTKLKSLLSVG